MKDWLEINHLLLQFSDGGKRAQEGAADGSMPA